MNHRTLLLGLSLLVSLQGCAAQFVSTKGATVALGATVDAQAAASVEAQPAQPTVVVAQIVGLRVHAAGQGAVQTVTGGAIAIERAGGIALSNVASGDLEIEAGAVEGEPSTVSGGTVTLESGVVLHVERGRVTLARNGNRWIIGSGRLVVTGTAAANANATVAGASTQASATTANASTTNATVALPGAVAGAQGTAAAGAQGTAAAGAVTMGRVQGVDVERITVDGGTQVVAGGEITLTGAPMAADLAIVEGAIDFEDADLSTRAVTASGVGVGGATRTTIPTAQGGGAAQGNSTGGGVGLVTIGAPTATANAGATATANTGARVQVRATARRTLRVRAGGIVVVSDRHGRRWRARVEGGELTARTDGTNPSGRVVWQPTGGELRITVLASGGDSLTVDSAGLPEATVELTPRVRGALSSLVGAVPADSREAARLAAAVEVVVRNAESAEPSFYAIPVRGRSPVVMVDVSYSMADADPQGSWFAASPSKLDVARAELVKVLASVPAGVRVNVVAFSSHVSTLWSASRTMDDASLAEAVRWVAALRPADETHPLEAMQAARALSPDQIVMLSDGRPSDSEAVLRALLAQVDAIAAQTRVDVVGFGADQDREFLGSLAAHGRGTLRLR